MCSIVVIVNKLAAIISITGDILMFYKKSALVFSILLLLGACTSMPSPEGEPVADLTFSHLSPVPLRVSNIIRNGLTQDQLDRMPQSFAVPIDNLINAYIKRRLRAAGGPEGLKITVEDLHVHYEQKDSESAVADFLGVAKIDSYTITVAMNLMLEDDASGAVRGRKFTARRVINISEHKSVAEREQHQLEGVEALFVDIDRAVLDILQHQFGL